jgi:predicted oxidoreductase
VETRRLGSSDLTVGPIAYGCWRLSGDDPSAVRGLIESALECGMTLIDTADIYGIDSGGGFGRAEERLGHALAEAPGLRERIVLATKGGIVPGVPYDSSPTYLRTACEASLRRLGVEVIDLYQIHRPDLLAHPADVAGVLAELRAAGKVREVGVSNHSPSQVAALQAHLGDVRLVTTQPELSLLRLDPIDDGTLDAAMASDLTPLAWSPLGGGRIASGAIPPGLASAIDAVAERDGVSRAAVALAWVMAHPSGPIPIIGTQRSERIRDAGAAVEVELSRADWYALVAAAGRELP